MPEQKQCCDDGELITKAWLLSLGFKSTDHPAKVTLYREDALPIGLWSVDDGWKVMIQSENWSSCIVRGLINRGHVRDLLAVLRYAKQEQADE